MTKPNELCSLRITINAHIACIDEYKGKSNAQVIMDTILLAGRHKNLL